MAKLNIQWVTPQTNWDAAHMVRVKEKKMEVDWQCQQNATDIQPRRIQRVAIRWTRDGNRFEDRNRHGEIRGARNGGSHVESRQYCKAGSIHTTVAYIGVGPMMIPTQVNLTVNCSVNRMLLSHI